MLDQRFTAAAPTSLPSSVTFTEMVSPVSFTWSPSVMEPPFVYSPGTQNNTVGQSVSLQVQAT